tara:strand:- start:7145 stop:8188 length:1044 start_codon:yes stop_codon:yes gene_type:complete
MSHPQFVHVPTADLARSMTTQVTIEAEYGSFVMEGTMYTAAHHQADGPYAGRHLPGLEQTGRPSPCNDKGIPVLTDGVVAVSHIDLDTIGGCLRTVAFHRKNLFDEEIEGFWALAEQIDVTGPHRLDRDHEWADHLLAFWAWLKDNRERYPREYVQDCTEFIYDAGGALNDLLLTDDEEMLQAGREMAEAEDAVNDESLVMLVETPNGRTVAVRQHSGFVNHLYRLPNVPNDEYADGVTGAPHRPVCRGVADAVVAFNSTMKSVTISLADPIEGVNCRDLVQGLWGPEAGGHTGIAGSPRGKEMSESDLIDAVIETAMAISGHISHPGVDHWKELLGQTVSAAVDLA